MWYTDRSNFYRQYEYWYKNEVFSNLLEPLKEANENNGFLPIYYPKNNFSATDLIDVDLENKGTCQTQDQRGLSRLVSNTYYYQTLEKSKNSCDIGSVELMKLTAGDLEGLSNISFTTLLETYQKVTTYMIVCSKIQQLHQILLFIIKSV